MLKRWNLVPLILVGLCAKTLERAEDVYYDNENAEQLEQVLTTAQREKQESSRYRRDKKATHTTSILEENGIKEALLQLLPNDITDNDIITTVANDISLTKDRISDKGLLTGTTNIGTTKEETHKVTDKDIQRKTQDVIDNKVLTISKTVLEEDDVTEDDKKQYHKNMRSIDSDGYKTDNYLDSEYDDNLKKNFSSTSDHYRLQFFDNNINNEEYDIPHINRLKYSIDELDKEENLTKNEESNLVIPLTKNTKIHKSRKPPRTREKTVILKKATLTRKHIYKIYPKTSYYKKQMKATTYNSQFDKTIDVTSPDFTSDATSMKYDDTNQPDLKVKHIFKDTRVEVISTNKDRQTNDEDSTTESIHNVKDNYFDAEQKDLNYSLYTDIVLANKVPTQIEIPTRRKMGDMKLVNASENYMDDSYQEDLNYSAYRDMLLKHRKDALATQKIATRSTTTINLSTDIYLDLDNLTSTEHSSAIDDTTASNAVGMIFDALLPEPNDTIEFDADLSDGLVFDARKAIPVGDNQTQLEDGIETTQQQSLGDEDIGYYRPRGGKRPIIKDHRKYGDGTALRAYQVTKRTLGRSTRSTKWHFKWKKPKRVKLRLDREKTTRKRRRKTIRRWTGTTKINVNAILYMIHNLSDEYADVVINIMNRTLQQWGFPTCPHMVPPTTTPTTTTTYNPFYNLTGTIMGKCFVCGIFERYIPRDTACHDAFASEIIPLTQQDPMARAKVGRYRKYCRWRNVPGYWMNKSDTKSFHGRWTGGCAVRWIDVSSQYTERVCRNRHRATIGNNFASKRHAKLEMSLQHMDNGCIVSPMSSLIPLSRGISLYARFFVCVCSTSWCNGAILSAQLSPFLVFVLFASTLRHLKMRCR